ncbi:MAG TPA: glycoside hydrolase family 2 TIM barrel-domain containing protein [Opitutaceae bacterium]|nr:glycoside hydrolase family 2 TIM barrel-domain containing protein [Opitutaceae bacterium]
MPRITPRLALFAIVTGVTALSTFAMAPKPAKSATARVTTSFDADWRFLKGNAAGAALADFDDSSWRVLDVPHDWSIEGPFAKENPTGGGGGFLPSGVGWYRKQFKLPADAAGKRVFIEFDGVMQNSDVWINGQHLGDRPFGYVSFRYELTGKLNFGDQANVLAVRADTSDQPASRWYSGAGIYRHVRLVVTDPVHLDHWETFVTTPEILFVLGTPEPGGSATVRVQTRVVNQSETPRDVTLHVTLLDPAGKVVSTLETPAQSVAGNGAAMFQQETSLTNPFFWHLNHPHLYRAVVAVRSAGRTLDEETVAFGIRDARFQADTGFWLNGHNFKIKGVCLHHDASALGAAVPIRAWERRLEALRELGVNAIRTAHNPVAPEFLDLCDRMGFLVLDELFDCWTVAKNPHDYHKFFIEWSRTDIRDTVRRDRNHPSVIAWSAGNEIHDTPKAELAKKILSGLVDVFHQNDPTRPVTQGLFRPNVSKDYDNGLADLLDVVGQNYRENEILAAHEQKPTRKILGTENGHDRRMWLALRDNAPYAGQFLWSGIDYLGEAHPWPAIATPFGLLDRTGTPRTRAFERQSWWSEKPMVHATRRTGRDVLTPTDPGYEPDLRHRQILFSDWTPRNQQPHDETVEVYSNCESVELFLNGASLGAKPLRADAAPREWKVAYAAGTLKAVGLNEGKVVATHELRTAGPAAKIQLTTDRARLTPSWEDISYVTAVVVDANGVLVPEANDLVTFTSTGAGAIVAVDSGNNASSEPFQASERRAFQGRCFALVKAAKGAKSGPIVITASAAGLKPDSISLTVAGAKK